MKAVVAAFNQEKALVGAFSVITNLRMELFEALVTGIMRAALMMGALIPLNINTMSIYSFSGKLCKQGNYIHPGYQMEDIIALIRKLLVSISS